MKASTDWHLCEHSQAAAGVPQDAYYGRCISVSSIENLSMAAFYSNFISLQNTHKN
jgi:hypothetical protein